MGGGRKQHTPYPLWAQGKKVGPTCATPPGSVAVRSQLLELTALAIFLQKFNFDPLKVLPEHAFAVFLGICGSSSCLYGTALLLQTLQRQEISPVSFSLRSRMFHFCPAWGQFCDQNLLPYYFIRSLEECKVQSTSFTARTCSVIFLFQSCQKTSCNAKEGR